MAVLFAVAQVLAAFAIPVAILKAEQTSRLVQLLSPVILCYLAGMFIGNVGFVPISHATALGLCAAMVVLAVPLLLFSVDVVGWLRLAPKTVLSFLCVVVLAALSAATAHFLLGHRVAESASVAGMLAGVYTGITANMAAIGAAAQVSAETFVLLNAADMAVSFLYLLFITLAAPRLLARVLRPFPVREDAAASSEKSTADDDGRLRVPTLRAIGVNLALTLLVVLPSLGVMAILPASVRDIGVVVALTTFAVGVSFSPRVRALPGTADMGQFFFLVFCVSMGFTTDFVKLFTASPVIVLYSGLILLIMTVLFLPLAALFRIDRDTAIITHVAGVFGPHMIAPVAMVLKNREIVFSGIASALVGIAIGNYLGLAVVWALS